MNCSSVLISVRVKFIIFISLNFANVLTDDNSQICPFDPVLNLSRDKEFLVFEILFLSPIASGFTM